MVRYFGSSRTTDFIKEPSISLTCSFSSREGGIPDASAEQKNRNWLSLSEKRMMEKRVRWEVSAVRFDFDDQI